MPTIRSNFFLALLLLIGCGIDKKPRYPDKNFGRGPKESPEARNEPREPQGGPIALATPEPTPPVEAPAKDEPTPDETPKKDEEQGAEEEEDDHSPPKGPQVVAEHTYKGYFVASSLRFITDGDPDERNGSVYEAPKPAKQLVDLFLRRASHEELGMRVVRKSETEILLEDRIETELGDMLSRQKGEPDQSGLQSSDWYIGDECPRTFVCIKRMWWESTSGLQRTFCYRDAKSGLATAFPFAPSPYFKKDAYLESLKPEGFGPYWVDQKEGLVSCDEKAPVVSSTLVHVDVRMGNLAALYDQQLPFFRKMTLRPIKPDLEIIMEMAVVRPSARKVGEYEKWDNERQPYLDELTRLYRKARYFLNTDKGVLVKMVSTIESRFDLWQPGSWWKEYEEEVRSWSWWNIFKYSNLGFAKLVQKIFDYHEDIRGVQLDYHFEFCHNAKSAEPFNHCVGSR